MAQELKSVKIIHGALDESPLRGGTLIMRGVIDPEALKNLKIDSYQREALPLSSLSSLIQAIKAGSVLPDIDVGMCGARTRDGADGTFLQDECYIIDGQQRVNACLAVLAQHPEVPIRLGATVHFHTEYTWERDRFRVLNANRIKVSPNVLMRNLRDEHPAVQSLYAFSDPGNVLFCMAGRVSWSQNMRRGELLTALNFAKTVGRLHAHISPGRAGSVDEVAGQLDVLMDKIGSEMMRDNIKTYFNVLDEVWGVRSVHHKELAPHLKGGFMNTFSRLLSNHTNFWRNAAEARLFIDADTRRKLASFKLRDPGIAQLASSSGPAGQILYNYLVQHLNYGKRKENRLKARPTADVQDPPDMTTDDDQQQEAA